MSLPSRQVLRRYQSTLTKKASELPETAFVQQAPNRVATWSNSQRPRSSVLKHASFLQKDLTKQPAPYAAIELIAKEPVRFVDDRIAVCLGNKQAGQGHPKVYINLDNPDKPIGTCGYCGLRYAQEKYKDRDEVN